MDSMNKNPWEIESIPFKIYDEIKFINTFNFYDDSKLLQSHFFKITTTDDFVSEIKNSQINTGIMISSMDLNNMIIYLCILDDRIFIIKQTNLPKFQEYFNERLKYIF